MISATHAENLMATGKIERPCMLFIDGFSKQGVSVAAGATSDYTFNVGKSGWTFLGVVQFAINSGGACTTVNIAIDTPNVVKYRIRNNGSSAVTPSSVYIVCLYQKA